MSDRSQIFHWNKAAIRLAADIAKEKGVIVKLNRDGSIHVAPLQDDAVEEMRNFIASQTLPEVW